MRALKPLPICLALVLAAAACGDSGGSGNNENFAPRLVPIGDRVARVGEALLIEIAATDPDGDALTFEVRDAPDGATFQADPTAAFFRWTPILSDAGPDGSGMDHQVSFLVSDTFGGSDSERITIRVESGDAGGAPRFVSASDYLLDLRNEERITFVVEVRDEDSPQVDLQLASDGGLKGYRFNQLDGHTARFTWAVEDGGAEAVQPVYVLRFRADDQDQAPVEQTVTLRVRRKGSGGTGGEDSCTGEPPTIEHVPVGDQSGGSELRIEARISDQESEVTGATLYFALGDGGEEDDASLESLPMQRVSGDIYEATLSLPNPPAGESLTVSYTLCALDDDDAAGSECDHLACVPERGSRLRFSVGATDQCSDDDLEPNATPAAAMLLADDEYDGLRLCPGDPDWFLLPAEAGARVVAVLFHNGGDDAVELSLRGGAEAALLASGTTFGGGVELDFTLPDDLQGSPFLEVSAPTSDEPITYDLLLDLRGAECAEDDHEPNNDPTEADFLPEESWESLGICPAGDLDHFAAIVSGGERLTAEILFDPEDDLDLYLLDEVSGETLDESRGITGEEQVSVTLPADAEDRFVLLRVQAFEARRTGDYQMRISRSNEQPCETDSSEPNDTMALAVALAVGDQRDALTICGDDEDWWKITLTEAGHSLHIDFTHTEADLDLRLIDDAGMNRGASSGTMDSESLELPYDAEMGGEQLWFVKVEAYQDRGSTDYSLRVE